MAARLLKVSTLFILALAILTSCTALEYPMEHTGDKEETVSQGSTTEQESTIDLEATVEHMGIKETKANDNKAYKSSFITLSPSSKCGSEENTVRYEVLKLLDQIMKAIQSGAVADVMPMFRVTSFSNIEILPYENLLFNYDDMGHALECSDAFDILYMPQIVINSVTKIGDIEYILGVSAPDGSNRTTLDFIRDDDKRWYMAMDKIAAPADIYATSGLTIRINGKFLDDTNSLLIKEDGRDIYALPSLLDGVDYKIEYLHDDTPDETKNGKEPSWKCTYETTLTPESCHNEEDNHRYWELKEVDPELIEKSLQIVKDFRNAIFTAAGTGDSSQLAKYISSDSPLVLDDLVKASKKASEHHCSLTNVILRKEQYYDYDGLGSPQITYYIDEDTYLLNLGFVYVIDNFNGDLVHPSDYGTVKFTIEEGTIKVHYVNSRLWDIEPNLYHDYVKEEY